MTASHIISALTAQVRRTSDGGIVQTKTIYPNALSASVLGTLNNSIIFDTMPAGDYTYHVVMEISSLGKSIEIIRSSFTIAPAEEPVMVIGNAISAESITLGQSVTTEISTSGGIGAISYRFEVYREGVVVDDSGYVDYSTLVYQPRETGSYQILAYAKDGQNTDFLPGLPFLVKAPSVPVAVVQLDREEVLLGLGDGATLIATVYPENASDKTLHWFSDQPAVADVDMYGEIWGHAVGSALITARAKDGSGVSAQCVVTVTEETPRPVEIVQSTISDDRLRLGAYQVCSIISSGGIGEVSYRFVAFRDDAVVFDTGYFPLNGVRYQPQETGNYTLHTFARDELGTTYYEGLPFVVVAAEEVPPVKVSQIVLGEDHLALKIGDSRTLTAQTAPADAADKRLSWVSDTPQVAAVDQSGVVTALAAGSARITVTAMDGGQASAVCTVLVSDPAAAQGKRGDATDDGRVDMEDLSAILDYLVNGTLCDSMGNANADAINGIDLRDLLWVIDQLIGS